MSDNLPDLRRLDYSLHENPLLKQNAINIRRKHVRVGRSADLADMATGEIHSVSVLHQIEEVDDANFVKIFAAGIGAAFELNKTSARIFQCILQEYEKTPLSKGYADTIYLSWIDGGLNGIDYEISERTYRRGLKDLLSKNFLAPKSPNIFWVNPSLFFKGNRAVFVKEYRRKQDTYRDKLEKNGQQRLFSDNSENYNT